MFCHFCGGQLVLKERRTGLAAYSVVFPALNHYSEEREAQSADFLCRAKTLGGA